MELLQGPDEIAVVHMKPSERCYTRNNGKLLGRPNCQKAALEEKEVITVLVNITDEGEREVPIFNEKEQEEIQKDGGSKDEQGRWDNAIHQQRAGAPLL